MNRLSKQLTIKVIDSLLQLKVKVSEMLNHRVFVCWRLVSRTAVYLPSKRMMMEAAIHHTITTKGRVLNFINLILIINYNMVKNKTERGQIFR